MLNKFMYKFANFMRGRYGNDALNQAMMYACCGLFLLDIFIRNKYVSLAAFVLWFTSLFRMFSKNIAKRYSEKQKFLVIKRKFSLWLNVKRDAWKNRKTHKYFHCKNCRASIRVPRGVGKIKVSCPKCRKVMIKKA